MFFFKTKFVTAQLNYGLLIDMDGHGYGRKYSDCKKAFLECCRTSRTATVAMAVSSGLSNQSNN